MEKLIKMKKVILRVALVFALFTCVLFICNQCANRTVYLTIVEPLNYKDNDIMVNSSMNGCIEFNAPNDSLDCWFYFKLLQSVSNLDVKAMEFEIDVACSFSYSTENRTSLKIIDILKS